MKLIETIIPKVETPLIWGAKYKVISGGVCDDIQVGEIVVLASSEVDGDGDVRVFNSENEYEWFTPEQLELLESEKPKPEIKPLTIDDIVVGKRYMASGKSQFFMDLDGEVVVVKYPNWQGFVSVEVERELPAGNCNGFLVNAEQLTPIVEEVEPVAEKNSYVIECTEDELTLIKKVIGQTSHCERKELCKIFDYNFDGGAVGSHIYNKLCDILV